MIHTDTKIWEALIFILILSDTQHSPLKKLKAGRERHNLIVLSIRKFLLNSKCLNPLLHTTVAKETASHFLLNTPSYTWTHKLPFTNSSQTPNLKINYPFPSLTEFSFHSPTNKICWKEWINEGILPFIEYLSSNRPELGNRTVSKTKLFSLWS